FNLADTVNELFGTRYSFNDLHNKLVVALFAHYLIISRAENVNKTNEDANKDKKE
ncbi:MAG: hypothetical protein HFJ21_05480, partial [Clostridia bacterium]|nr:hypothetical protein [Clostridia bacterium]